MADFQSKSIDNETVRVENMYLAAGERPFSSKTSNLNTPHRKVVKSLGPGLNRRSLRQSEKVKKTTMTLRYTEESDPKVPEPSTKFQDKKTCLLVKSSKQSVKSSLMQPRPQSIRLKRQYKLFEDQVLCQSLDHQNILKVAKQQERMAKRIESELSNSQIRHDELYGLKRDNILLSRDVRNKEEEVEELLRSLHSKHHKTMSIRDGETFFYNQDNIDLLRRELREKQMQIDKLMLEWTQTQNLNRLQMLKMQGQNQRLQNKIKDMMGLSPRRFNTDLNPIIDEIEQVRFENKNLVEEKNKQASLNKILEQRCIDIEETMEARIKHLTAEHEQTIQAKDQQISDLQLKIEEQRQVISEHVQTITDLSIDKDQLKEQLQIKWVQLEDLTAQNSQLTLDNQRKAEQLKQSESSAQHQGQMKDQTIDKLKE